MPRSIPLLLWCLWAWVALPAVAADIDAAELTAIATLGPWPMPAKADLDNPVAGRPAAIALGERLFASPSLSGTGSVACTTCHAPWRRFTDGRALALGLEIGTRNTPSVLNVAQYPRYGWEGLNDRLWKQSIRPLLDAREMRSGAAHVARVVHGDPGLQAMYRSAFEAAPPANEEALLADIGRALAAYQATLHTDRTPFDHLRDALVSGDAGTTPHYPADARRGLALFVGKGQCIACHAGPLFSDGRLHGGIRTPGLREVAATGPYMHDGRIDNLCDALQAHAGSNAPALQSAERRDLVAFLRTLGSDDTPPFTDPAGLRCR